MHDCSSGAIRPTDALSEVLRDLRLSDGSYGRCELTAPWGIRFEPRSQARFHHVVDGSCWLGDPAGEWRALQRGDVVLLPHGEGHTLASKPRGRSKPLEQMPLEEVGDRTYDMRAGGAGATTVLVCCSVSFAQPGMQPLLALMPKVIALHGAAAQDATFVAILRAMEEEVLGARIASATIMVRLADVLIARVIRDWVESREHDTRGWLAAIRDPRVGRALAAIHRRPGEAWSLASLAREARTSRSVFAERFASVVGMSPGRYLAQWRMRLACEWLRRDRTTVAEAATQLGYDSEAAFSRAFKRFAGRPPSAVRREGRSAASATA